MFYKMERESFRKRIQLMVVRWSTMVYVLLCLSLGSVHGAEKKNRSDGIRTDERSDERENG